MAIGNNKADSITEFNRKLVKKVIQRVANMSYARGILNDLLDSVLTFQQEPEDKEVDNIHDISNSSTISDIFHSGLSEETHHPPSRSDYWLLDKIKENQPEHISQDKIEELNKSSSTPPVTQTPPWSWIEGNLENTIDNEDNFSVNNVEEIVLNSFTFLENNDRLRCNSSSREDSINKEENNSSITFNDIYKSWVDATGGAASSWQVSETQNQDMIKSEKRTFNQTQEAWEFDNSFSSKSSFPGSVKKIKLNIELADNDLIENRNIEFEETYNASTTLCDALEEDIENERFQSLTPLDNHMTGNDEHIKQPDDFLSDNINYIPMTFDSSVDLIWQLKKAQVLPSNGPVENQRPKEKIGEPKSKVIKSSLQVDHDMNRLNYFDHRKNLAIVPEGSENIDNEEDIETSMFITEAADKKEPPSMVVDIIPQNSSKCPDNIVLGTPPQPQQGLCLLHKAPRIGLTKLQNLITLALHPRQR